MTEIIEPKMPTSVAAVKALGWEDLCLIFATSFAPAIHAVADEGDTALRTELKRWEPEARNVLRRVLAELA